LTHVRNNIANFHIGMEKMVHKQF